MQGEQRSLVTRHQLFKGKLELILLASNYPHYRMLPSPYNVSADVNWPACKKFEKLKRIVAAIKIEKHVRKWRAWVAYTRLRVSVLAVQTCLRAIEGRKRYKFRKETNAAIKIQTRWRCHKNSAYYKRLKKGSIVTQCSWRGRIARELRKLKMAARETGALKETKDKLEKQLEELTWRLQLEKRLRTDLEEAKT